MYRLYTILVLRMKYIINNVICLIWHTYDVYTIRVVYFRWRPQQVVQVWCIHKGSDAGFRKSYYVRMPGFRIPSFRNFDFVYSYMYDKLYYNSFIFKSKNVQNIKLNVYNIRNIKFSFTHLYFDILRLPDHRYGILS